MKRAYITLVTSGLVRVTSVEKYVCQNSFLKNDEDKEEVNPKKWRMQLKDENKDRVENNEAR